MDHKTCVLIIILFLPSAEPGSVQQIDARETLHTAEASAGSEMPHTDRAIQGTRDFLPAVYPLI